LLIASCAKQKNYRQLKGTWNIDHYEVANYYNGSCGIMAGGGPFSVVGSDQAGTIDFTGDEVGEESGETTFSGSIHFDYSFIDVYNFPQHVEETIPFEYFVWRDDDHNYKVTMFNYQNYLYDVWPLDDLHRKKFNTSRTDVFDCHYTVFTFELSQ